jgi:hypothetical protein
VVEHQLGDDANAALVGFGQQPREVVARAVVLVDARVVRDVVAAVAQR